MRFVSLQSKDVINVYDGKKIGYIADIEVDWCQRCIQALIVEKINFFHFLCFFKLNVRPQFGRFLGCKCKAVFMIKQTFS